MALSLGASACNLYFGPSDNQDHWTYCDQTGCYDCVGNVCTPQGGSGYQCASQSQCAPGCYCDMQTKDPSYGTCVESGFCGPTTTCQAGYTCDSRGTCEPNGNPTGCSSSADCASGSYCDMLTGQCTPSTTCKATTDCPSGDVCDSRGTCVPAGCTDSSMCASGCYCDTTAGDPNQGQCVETGYCNGPNQCPSGYYCDTTRSTCMPGTDPNAPSCAGTIASTCTTGQPKCQSGQVPTIQNGCWTGQCEALASCDKAPTCAVINDEADCTARTDCSPVYNGINCTKPDGSTCKSGDTNCTCQTYVFASCESKTPGV
jgi:hypothetical protein